jgi:hypothetical protein
LDYKRTPLEVSLVSEKCFRKFINFEVVLN